MKFQSQPLSLIVEEDVQYDEHENQEKIAETKQKNVVQEDTKLSDKNIRVLHEITKSQMSQLEAELDDQSKRMTEHNEMMSEYTRLTEEYERHRQAYQLLNIQEKMKEYQVPENNEIDTIKQIQQQIQCKVKECGKH